MTHAEFPLEPSELTIPPGSLADEETKIRVVSESRFMQNYRVASAVHGGSCTAAFINDTGNVELVTSGADTKIWNFYEDPKSGTGVLSTCVEMTGELLATDLTPSGNVVLFAAQGTMLTYQVQHLGVSERWGDVRQIHVELPSDAVRIARICTAQIGGDLYLGVLVQVKNGTYALSYGVWGSKAPEKLQQTQLTFQSANGVWTGNSAATAAFTLYDNIIVQYHVATGKVEWPAVEHSFNTIAVCAASDDEGETQVLAIHADANIYQLSKKADTPYKWKQLTKNIRFKQLAILRPETALEAIILSEDNRIYHAQLVGLEDEWSLPLPIHGGAQSFTAACKDSGDIELFAIGERENTVTRLTRGGICAHWVAAPLALATSGAMTTFASFTSDITVYDSKGVPLGNTAVAVRAEEACRLTINGGVYHVTAKYPARIHTNAFGNLSISQEPASLAAPALLINVAGSMDANESIVIRQNAQVQETLHAVTAEDLLSATIASGKYLLAEPYHTKTSAEPISQAVRRCMGITHSAYRSRAAGDSFLDGSRQSAGVSFHIDNDPPPGALSSDELPEQHWHLWVENGRLFFRDISPEEAQDVLANLYRSSNVSGFWDTIGDIVAGVEKGIIEVIDQVVTTVEKVIEATVHYVFDGLHYALTTTVDTVAKAFDLTHGAFAMVRVFFWDLYEWLGHLFDWNNILRTRDAVSYTVNVGLDFLSDAVAKMQEYLDGGIETLQEKLAGWFTEARTAIGDISLGGFIADHTPNHPKTTLSVANNVVFNSLINNASAATCKVDLTTMLQSDDACEEFFTKLNTLVELCKSQKAFKEAWDYFVVLGAAPDRIVENSLCVLLSLAEGIIQAILGSAQVVLDALLACVSAMVKAVQKILNAEWNIPFVSELYEHVSGRRQLTTLDLFSLTLAVPGTVLYHSLKQQAPFPNKETLDAYTRSFDAARMLKVTGLGNSSQRELLETRASDSTGLLSRDAALAAGLLGAVAYYCYGCTTALIDGLPLNETTPRILSYFSFLCELGAQILSFPWFFSLGGIGCLDADGAARALWFYLCVGIFIDLFGLIEWKGMPKNKDDMCVFATHFFGTIHLVLAIPASHLQRPTVLAMNVAPAIAEICKFLRHSQVAAETDEVSLAVLSCIDHVCYKATTILTVVNMALGTELTATPQPRAPIASAS